MNLNELKTIKLAAVTQGDAQDVIQQIVQEAGVSDFQLIRESDNAFDSNAVRVDCCTMFVGYIPKELSAEVAQIIDAGVILKGQLNKVNKCSGHSTLGLTIDIVEAKNTQEMSAGYVR